MVEAVAIDVNAQWAREFPSAKGETLIRRRPPMMKARDHVTRSKAPQRAIVSTLDLTRASSPAPTPAAWRSACRRRTRGRNTPGSRRSPPPARARRWSSTCASGARQPAKPGRTRRTEGFSCASGGTTHSNDASAAVDISALRWPAQPHWDGACEHILSEAVVGAVLSETSRRRRKVSGAGLRPLASATLPSTWLPLASCCAGYPRSARALTEPCDWLDSPLPVAWLADPASWLQKLSKANRSGSAIGLERAIDPRH